MMKAIFAAVLEMSLSGGAVILAVLVCRVLLWRCPKKVTVFLWFPAALQLVLPVSVPSAVSFFNLLPRGIAGWTETLLQNPVPTEEISGMTSAAAPVQNAVPSVPAVLPSASAALPAAEPVQMWTNIAFVLWLAGMAVMLVWAAVQYGRVAGKVKTAVRMDGERNVYQSENIASPFILGVLRPGIYVPYHMDSVSAWQVLAHERTHLRLGDHLTKLIGFLILTVHWFNPLCWLAFALYGRDVEMRCDEAVLAYSEPKEYGTALVTLAVERRYSVADPLAFGETSVKERVKHILSWKKPALWITIAAVVLCTVVVVVCATDAVESPYGWTSAVAAEDFSRRDVTLHGYGLYEAEFTDDQLAELAQCLRNVPESAMHMYWRDINSSKRLINYTIDSGSDYGIFLVWDGDRVILSSIQQVNAVRVRRSAWRLDDPALENFFIELEASILAGQGTLVEESVAVSVWASGTDTVIAPKWYPEGTWEHQYDELPVLVMSESGHLCIHVYWQPETLYVYEEYYHSISADTTQIRRTTYTAAGPHADGGYTIEVTRENPKQDEEAIYYITNGDEKYIFKVVFPVYNADLPIVGIEEALIREKAAGKYTDMTALYGSGVVERMMTRLRDEEGLSFREAKITGMEVMNTGTAGLYVSHAMIRIDYALLPAEGTKLPETVTAENGWITGYTPEGSPYLVLTAAEDEITCTAETCETAVWQNYSEQDRERYGNPYTAMTMFLAETFRAPTDADYIGYYEITAE